MALKPLIVAWQSKSAQAAGGVAEHPLSAHSGTLLDAQAPQFLLRNGLRSLTGNLAVDEGNIVHPKFEFTWLYSSLAGSAI